MTRNFTGFKYYSSRNLKLCYVGYSTHRIHFISISGNGQACLQQGVNVLTNILRPLHFLTGLLYAVHPFCFEYRHTPKTQSILRRESGASRHCPCREALPRADSALQPAPVLLFRCLRIDDNKAQGIGVGTRGTTEIECRDSGQTR